MFGKKIRYYRIQSGLTQKELAGKVGISRAMINYFENEKRTPTPEILSIILQTIDITMDQFEKPFEFPDNNIEDLGKKIQYYRRQVGLTQKELAKKIEKSSLSISLYENGKRNPDFTTLLRICNAIQIDINQFNQPLQCAIDSDENFGETIRHNRIQAGLSQKELAQMMELHPTVLNAYEKGRKKPNATTFEKICETINENARKMEESSRRKKTSTKKSKCSDAAIENLGEKLQYYRICAKLTQAELASMVGVYIATINYYEKGKRRLRYQTLLKICKALGIQIDELEKPFCFSRKSIKNIGETIRYYRLQAGLTQKELEEKVGLHFSTINYYERNMRNPNSVILSKICEAIGVNINDFKTKKINSQ